MRSQQPKDIFSYLKELSQPGLRGFSLFFLLSFSCLITLGTWQLNRLEWKNTLIKIINGNLIKTPITLDRLLTAILIQKENPNYRRVQLTGILEPQNSFKHLGKVHKNQLGYHLITPLRNPNGARILVNLGWVPKNISFKSLALPKNKITLVGFVRTETGKNSYTPENNYKTHELFAIDPLEVAHQKTWPTLLPFYIVRASEKPFKKPYPIAMIDRPSIRNHHLEYALTWYLLALFWGIGFTFYMRKEIKEKFNPKQIKHLVRSEL